MRWMSNLFRLAFLEEIDRRSALKGCDPRHHREIRRLRHMSMAPKAGRYYPVADDADADDFMTPEEARELVETWQERWRIRALTDDPDIDFVIFETSPNLSSHSPLESDDEEGPLAFSSLTPSYPEHSRRAPWPLAPAADEDRDKFNIDAWDEADSDEADWEADDSDNDSTTDDDSDDNSTAATNENSDDESLRSFPVPHSHFPISTQHDYDDNTPDSRPAKRRRNFATYVALALLGALLGLAASWFLESQTELPEPHSQETELLSIAAPTAPGSLRPTQSGLPSCNPIIPSSHYPLISPFTALRDIFEAPQLTG
jgi:hypothetical protein